jgi:hypothetical protein
VPNGLRRAAQDANGVMRPIAELLEEYGEIEFSSFSGLASDPEFGLVRAKLTQALKDLDFSQIDSNLLDEVDWRKIEFIESFGFNFGLALSPDPTAARGSIGLGIRKLSIEDADDIANGEFDDLNYEMTFKHPSVKLPSGNSFSIEATLESEIGGGVTTGVSIISEPKR